MSAGPAAPDPLLAQLGTVLPTRSASARSTAALLNNPSCVRRAVLDGARVDLGEVATRLGSPPQFGQSPFALGQGNRFERRVKANDYEELVRVVDELLGIFGGLTSLRSVSVERVPTNGLSLIEARARATADLLVAIATGDPTAPHVIDHGVTTLVVGGVAVYLEQDALAFREGERLRICEVKGFPIIDGSADPQKVGAAARQSAVYVASIQDTLAARGLDPALVSEEIILICPKNFTVQPTAALVDVSREVRALRRQLRRRSQLGAVIQDLRNTTMAQGVDLIAMLNAVQAQGGSGLTLGEFVDQLPYSYSPACLSECDFGRHCRSCAMADDQPARLGGQIAGLVGDVPTVAEAFALAANPQPDPDVAEVASILNLARRSIDRAMGGQP